jgi:hypothetical protein
MKSRLLWRSFSRVLATMLRFLGLQTASAALLSMCRSRRKVYGRLWCFWLGREEGQVEPGWQERHQGEGVRHQVQKTRVCGPKLSLDTLEGGSLPKFLLHLGLPPTRFRHHHVMVRMTSHPSPHDRCPPEGVDELDFDRHHLQFPIVFNLCHCQQVKTPLI